MTEKMERVTIRMPSHLDKQIMGFAKKYYPTASGGDYSKAVRFLCQLGLISSSRLTETYLKEISVEDVSDDNI